jgi:hypothetical protein
VGEVTTDSRGLGFASLGDGDGTMGPWAIAPPNSLYGLPTSGYDSTNARKGCEAYRACRIELQ